MKRRTNAANKSKVTPMMLKCRKVFGTKSWKEGIIMAGDDEGVRVYNMSGYFIEKNGDEYLRNAWFATMVNQDPKKYESIQERRNLRAFVDAMPIKIDNVWESL